MSNLSSTVETECRVSAAGDAITQLLQPRERDIGGLSVRRLLPDARQRAVGPWVFFDHMGPASFPAGQGIDVRPHPHIGLATVTYLFEGEMLHRDSLGSVQAIRPGDINLMVAGRGIVHSERESPEVRGRAHRVHGLQLWLALPAELEETEPAFQHTPAEALPATRIDGVELRVMMGQAYGLQSPVRTDAPTLYVEARLPAGASLDLPAAPERALYVAAGRLCIGQTQVPPQAMAVLKPGQEICIRAEEESRIALIGGESLGPRHMHWNFVSSRRERIEQAREDWRAGRFPPVPGDDKEFIPLPD